MSRDPSTDDDFRRKVCDWLRANGLDPAQVWRDPQISITDFEITLIRKVRRDGRDVLTPDRSDVLRETVTVPLLEPPDGDVAEWLRPRCPTCGR